MKFLKHVLSGAKRAVVIGASLAIVLPIVAFVIMPETATASSVPPTCRNNQLEVAVGFGPGPAAGNAGIPFIIVNVSGSDCTLKGYPKLAFVPASYKKTSIKVTRGGGMIYGPVKPRLVVIKPGATASFGLDFVNAANQQDPLAGLCMVQNMYVTLPARTATLPKTHETTVNFNFCHSNFRVDVTSIQAGPLPKEG
jgi:hypothetical protein